MDRDRGGYDGVADVVGKEIRDGPWLREVE